MATQDIKNIYKAVCEAPSSTGFHIGHRTVGTLRTTYLVNEEGVIEKIFPPKEMKTKIHAEQILDYLKK